MKWVAKALVRTVTLWLCVAYVTTFPSDTHPVAFWLGLPIAACLGKFCAWIEGKLEL